MIDPMLLNRKKVDEMCRFTAIRRGVVKKVENVEGLNVATVMLVDLGLELSKVDIASSMAHKGTGVVALPSEEDEVLVGFLDDNINQAVILGSLYNSKNTPPIKVDDKNLIIDMTLPAGKASDGKKGLNMSVSCEDNKQKVTFKTQKEHIFEYDDDKEIVTVKAKGDKNSIIIKLKDGTIEINAEKTISMKAGDNEVKLDSNNGFEVNCKKGDCKVTAQNTKYDNKSNFEVGATKVALQAKSGFEAGGATAKVEAKSNMDLKANANMNVNANAIMTIKGSMTKIN